MLAGWFPFSALIHQQSQLDAVRSQLSAVQRQQASLVQQAKSIDTKSAAIQLAREQYQLVAPGQSLIQVLPGLEDGQLPQSSGDPGLQPLVAPSSASSLVNSPTPSTTTKSPSTSGFVSRLVRTLEFWR